MLILLFTKWRYNTRVFLRNASETGFSSENTNLYHWRLCLWTRVFLSSCKIKVQPQNKSWQLVDSSSSRDTTSTSQAAFVFNCSSTKTNNRHVFALRNVSLRECISIIHVSECVCVCVCVCVSKQGKKKRGSFGSFQFISTNGFQASSDNQAAAAWSMHQRGREEMRIPSRDAKNSRHSAIQLLPCISSKTQTQNCALKHLPSITTILNAAQTN